MRERASRSSLIQLSSLNPVPKSADRLDWRMENATAKNIVFRGQAHRQGYMFPFQKRTNANAKGASKSYLEYGSLNLWVFPRQLAAAGLHEPNEVRGGGSFGLRVERKKGTLLCQHSPNPVPNPNRPDEKGMRRSLPFQATTSLSENWKSREQCELEIRICRVQTYGLSLSVVNPTVCSRPPG